MSLSLRILVFIVFMVCLVEVSEAQSFATPLMCKFQFGQWLEADTAKVDNNPTPLEWNFSGLRSDRPSFLSGGDTGPVLVHFHEVGEGVSLFIKQGNGAHLFTIWPDGQAFWSKQNNLLGFRASQQRRGTCEPIRTVRY